MPLTLYPVTPSCAAEIGDADLSRPLPAQDVQHLIDAFNHFSVLVFPDQHHDADRHLSFAQLFGPLKDSIGKHVKDNGARIRTELSDVSNLKEWPQDPAGGWAHTVSDVGPKLAQTVQPASAKSVWTTA